MNRVALVIGNSEYLNIGKLNNPKNDANDIASILGKLNFDVEKVIDADLLDIQRSVNKFLQALDEYAVGLFFYAGHGMQIDGKNYIVPVDLKLGDKSRTTVVICVQIAVTTGAADTLQRVDHNELCRRMPEQELLDLLLQPVLERVGHDRKVQRRRGIFRQVKESRLDALERIFETDIQRFSLRCCKIPECLPWRR